MELNERAEKPKGAKKRPEGSAVKGRRKAEVERSEVHT